MLMLPKQFRQPGVKPVGPVEIDPTHPLAAGLEFYAISPQDLVSDAVAAPVSAFGAALSAYSYGLHGFQFESHSLTNGGFRFALSDDALSRINGSKFITVAVLAAIDSASSFGKFAVIPWHVTNWTSPWIGLSFDRTSSGTAGNLSFAFGGVSKAATSGLNYFLIDSVYRLYAATKNDTLTAEFYRDGVPFTSNTGPAGYGDAIGLSSQRSLYTMSRNDTASGEGFNGRVALIAVWARELSASEHAEFYADPYALLRPKVPPVYFTPFSAGQILAIGTAVETDAPIATGFGLGLGVGLETDTALAVIVGGTSALITTVLEADTALPFGFGLGLGVGLETDTPLALGLGLELGLASETDVVQALGLMLSLATVSETDTALSVTVSGVDTIAIGAALETDRAFAFNSLQIFSDWTERFPVTGTWDEEATTSGDWGKESAAVNEWDEEAATSSSWGKESAVVSEWTEEDVP